MDPDEFLNELMKHFMDIAIDVPLDEVREQRLVSAAKAGDIGARKELIKANLRGNLVVCREVVHPGIAVFDLLIAASEALARSIDGYNAEKHGAFRPYAREAARRALMHWVSEHVPEPESGA